MVAVAWSTEYSVGIAALDAQHRNLVEVMGRLHAAMADGEGEQAVSRTLDELIGYAREHFVTEERLLETLGYPEYAAHKQEHDEMRLWVQRFLADRRAGRLMLSLEIMDYLDEWFDRHVVGTDKRYTRFLQERGIR